MKHKADIDSRDLELLVPEFRQKADEVIAKCAERGVAMKPFFTLRGPSVQAKLWCQSRTRAEMALRAGELRGKGAFLLADLLKPAWCNTGQSVTNALPGNSWHQFGEALDCVLLWDGKSCWDSGNDGYAVYAEVAHKAGLAAGHYWRSKDSVHIQLRQHASPAMVYSWPEIERRMSELYEIGGPVIQ